MSFFLKPDHQLSLADHQCLPDLLSSMATSLDSAQHVLLQAISASWVQDFAPAFVEYRHVPACPISPPEPAKLQPCPWACPLRSHGLVLPAELMRVHSVSSPGLSTDTTEDMVPGQTRTYRTR